MPERRISRWLVSALAAVLAGLVFFSVYAYYTNFAQIGNLMRVVYLVRTQALTTAGAAHLAEGAASGLVEALDDPYSEYLDAETFKRLRMQLDSTFGGLGILVGIRQDQLTVVRPYADTPAAEAEILEGDVIAKIDGTDTTGMDLETAVGLMKGPVGTKVELLIRRDGHDQLLPFTLTRDEIRVPTVYSEMLEGNIGHVAVTQFAEQSPRELEQALSELKDQGMKALVLDLRDNPGGSLTSAVDAADIFLGKGPIVFVDFRAAKDESYYAHPPGFELPLVVLINENSASAAEILAGAIKDSGTGKLVGQRSFGKGVIQVLYELEDGAGLKLTTGRYLTPSRYDLNGRGIQPDVVVEQPEDGDDDRQLQKAVEMLK